MLLSASEYDQREVTIPARQITGDSFQALIHHFSRTGGLRAEDQTDEFGP